MSVSVRLVRMIMQVAWEHHIRGRRWDDISARIGLLPQTDTVHFNRHGTHIVANLIVSWLHERPAWLPVLALPDLIAAAREEEV